MAKDKGKKVGKRDKERQDEDATARLQLDDDRPTLAVGVGPERPWLDPDRPEGPGPQDTTDPRTAPTPEGVKIEQSLQDIGGIAGGKAIPTGPNRHGLGKTFPGEKDLTDGKDLLAENDAESLLKEFDLRARADGSSGARGGTTPGRGSQGTATDTTEKDVSRASASSSSSSEKTVGSGGQGGGGKTDGGQMGSLDDLPPGVELNDNAPNTSWYSADAKGNTTKEDTDGFLGIGVDKPKEFKPATAESFKEKQDKDSGNTAAAHQKWLKDTADGGTSKKKYTDPDYVEPAIDTSEPPPDPGAGISRTVNPLDDNPGTIDTSSFDPKADPNAPYILRDPDAVDVPVTADTTQPPPDPGAGISKIVNPLDNPVAGPPGGTLNGGPGGGGSGDDSTPQVAVATGNDFAAPDADAPGSGAEPVAVGQDLDGDGNPG